MNQTLIRSILKIGAGILIAKGCADESTGEVIVAGLTALIAVVWGMFHRTPPPTGTAPVTVPITNLSSQTPLITSVKGSLSHPGAVLLLWVAASALFLLTGCASIKQQAETTLTDPKTGLVESRSTSASIVATGDAKQAVEKLNGSASTKTATIGATGASQESNMSETFNALANVIRASFEAGLAAGQKTVVPTP